MIAPVWISSTSERNIDWFLQMLETNPWTWEPATTRTGRRPSVGHIMPNLTRNRRLYASPGRGLSQRHRRYRALKLAASDASEVDSKEYVQFNQKYVEYRKSIPSISRWFQSMWYRHLWRFCAATDQGQLEPSIQRNMFSVPHRNGPKEQHFEKSKSEKWLNINHDEPASERGDFSRRAHFNERIIF